MIKYIPIELTTCSPFVMFDAVLYRAMYFLQGHFIRNGEFLGCASEATLDEICYTSPLRTTSQRHKTEYNTTGCLFHGLNRTYLLGYITTSWSNLEEYG